jgi:hypothetical protein
MKTYDELVKEYAIYYDVENLATPNDRSNFDNLVRNQVRINALNEEIDKLLKGDEDGDINVLRLKKVQDIVRDITNQNLEIERTLAIDRKARKKDDTETVAGYITTLKTKAREYLDKQYITVWCKTCNVMVARLLPVHEHTSFECSFTCSQCNKPVKVQRKEKDIFFDLPRNDREWRRQYPTSIELPSTELDVEDTEDEIVLDGETE